MSKKRNIDDRKKEIIVAALKIISDRGFEGMTIDAIAEKAGCSHGIINYYFKSKKKLIVESFRFFLEYYNLKIKEDIVPGMNEQKILRVIVKHALPERSETKDHKGKEFILSYKMKTNLFIQFFSQARYDLELEEVFKEIYYKQFYNTISLIESGSRNGRFKKIDAALFAFGFLALIIGLSNFRTLDFFPEEIENDKKVMEFYIKSILNIQK